MLFQVVQRYWNGHGSDPLPVIIKYVVPGGITILEWPWHRIYQKRYCIVSTISATAAMNMLQFKARSTYLCRSIKRKIVVQPSSGPSPLVRHFHPRWDSYSSCSNSHQSVSIWRMKNVTLVRLGYLNAGRAITIMLTTVKLVLGAHSHRNLAKKQTRINVPAYPQDQ